MNYTWRIHSLTKETKNSIDDVIVEVLWEKIGVDPIDYHKGSVKRKTEFTEEQLKPNSFIPYSDLKKQDIINWIKYVVNEEQINNQIEIEINKSRVNRVLVKEEDFPWNKKEK